MQKITPADFKIDYAPNRQSFHSPGIALGKEYSFSMCTVRAKVKLAEVIF